MLTNMKQFLYNKSDNASSSASSLILFDTIDFSVLFERASIDFGICGPSLGWLKSFVTGRSSTSASGRIVQRHRCLSGAPA